MEVFMIIIIIGDVNGLNTTYNIYKCIILYFTHHDIGCVKIWGEGTEFSRSFYIRLYCITQYINYNKKNKKKLELIILFIQDFKDLIEKMVLNAEDSKKENSIKIETIDESSSATQVSENKCIEDFTSIKPIKEVLPINVIEEVKINSAELKPAETSSILTNKKSKSIKKCHIRCLTCNSNTHSIVPVCNWYQNKKYVYLKFDILEIDDFKIECTMHSIILK